MRAGAVPLLVALPLASCTGQAPVDHGAASSKPSSAGGQANIIRTADFTLSLPEGYIDQSAETQKLAPHIAVTFVAKTWSMGYQPTITVQKGPLPGGSFADAATCARTGNGLMTGGTESPGIQGTLRSASLVDGPVGKTCQIHILAAEGIALVTELHRPGNTPTTPQDLWLMTCNHADGDRSAESICRSTLAGFRFTR